MGIYKDVIFPKFFDVVLQHKVFDQKRAEALSKVQGKILEIGIGTGLNLDRYPESVNEIYAVDPNPGMEKELLKKSADHRIKVNFSLTGAENMPYEDNTFDTVVSTITICSIPDIPASLREIQRVLKPDGQFIFLDHGLSPIQSVAKFQKLINPLQAMVGAGCSLTVNIEKELLEAGFVLKSLDKYHIEKAPKFIGSVYDGVAVLSQS